jgi:GAF domain-containing protein
MKRPKPSPEAGQKLLIDWSAPTRFKVPIPKDEPERLQDLRGYKILDTLPEDEFDNITLLASQICHTPIAMISLVDSDRQWFKSKVGISLSETSRDIAFCAHAIMQHDLFIVSDASKDKRFNENPLVRFEPKIRFYAGAPLVSPDDHALGTLCVMDHEPRQMTTGQKESLRALSRAVMARLDMRRRILELEEVLHDRNNHEKTLKKNAHAVKSAHRSQGSFLRKAAHELSATANAIVTVTQRALLRPCTPDQHDCLKTARSSAGALLALAREMKRVAEGK